MNWDFEQPLSRNMLWCGGNCRNVMYVIGNREQLLISKTGLRFTFGVLFLPSGNYAYM